jgi:putative chitinase
MYDRDIYFETVRASLFGGELTQQQVDGQTVILAVWEYAISSGVGVNDERWLAYMLATVFHECATRMWPITEYGSDTYLQGKDYWPYIGRGFVMITWEENYRHASDELGLIDDRDLVAHPELALDSLIATRILFMGMINGWFTGRKLSQYFNDTEDDPVNARQIVNGNDDDELIAGYHHKFMDALTAARVPDADAAPMSKVFIGVVAGSNVEVAVEVNGVEYGT